MRVTLLPPPPLGPPRFLRLACSGVAATRRVSGSSGRSGEREGPRGMAMQFHRAAQAGVVPFRSSEPRAP